MPVSKKDVDRVEDRMIGRIGGGDRRRHGHRTTDVNARPQVVAFREGSFITEAATVRVGGAVLDSNTEEAGER